MAWLFALTIPGLVLGLVVLGALDRLGVRRPRSRTTGASAAAVGFDLFQTVFHPGKEHELQRRQTELLWREDAEEGAPPHSRVDLEAGRAVIVPPRDGG